MTVQSSEWRELRDGLVVELEAGGRWPGVESESVVIRLAPFLASGGRWSGLSPALTRAAPELYVNMRQGAASVREWYSFFGINRLYERYYHRNICT